MPYFVVSLKPTDNRKFQMVTGGENATDAVITAFREWGGNDRLDDALQEYEADLDDGGYNALAERLLAEVFDCTEIHRAMVLEYVERRLDGDGTYIRL